MRNTNTQSRILYTRQHRHMQVSEICGIAQKMTMFEGIQQYTEAGKRVSQEIALAV